MIRLIREGKDMFHICECGHKMIVGEKQKLVICEKCRSVYCLCCGQKVG